MMIPLISIIIPCYNASFFLKSTLNSILLQTFTEFEVIIINDGSTDHTLLIAQQIAELDERIFIYSIENCGVSVARNIGLSYSRARYIVFFDSDDIMLPKFLEDRFLFLESNPEISGCGGQIVFITVNDKIIDGHKKVTAPGLNVINDILLYNPNVASCPSNFMFRRNIIIINKISFSEELSSTADKYFLCKIGKVSQLRNIESSTFLYRVHDNSMSHLFNRNLFYDNELFFLKIMRDRIVPDQVLGKFKTLNYYMLAGLSFKVKLYNKMLFYGFKYFVIKSKNKILNGNSIA